MIRSLFFSPLVDRAPTHLSYRFIVLVSHAPAMMVRWWWWWVGPAPHTSTFGGGTLPTHVAGPARSERLSDSTEPSPYYYYYYYYRRPQEEGVESLECMKKKDTRNSETGVTKTPVPSYPRKVSCVPTRSLGR